MKILFYGDSITDALRSRDVDGTYSSYGNGFVAQIAGRLIPVNPEKYQIINHGISGDRIVDLYARIKKSVWNENPDVLNILVGINDVWHEIFNQNGVDLERFEKVYDMLLSDTKKMLPKTKIMLMEPFITRGEVTDADEKGFSAIYEYAAVVKKLAEKYDAVFIPLQEDLFEAVKKHPTVKYLFDGVHPDVAGSALIAEKWIKFFKEKVDD